MATYQLLKSEVLPLTRELAVEHQNLEPSPTERELNPSRIKHLHGKATEGLLINFNWAKAKVGDKWLRMNGQHSSTMLTQLNGSFPDGLYVHMDSYVVDDEFGLALLFRQFDDRKSSRTAADVAGAYQMLHEDLRALPRPIGKLGVEGVVYYRREIDGQSMPSGDDQYMLFKQPGLHPFLLWLGEVFSIKTPELRRQAIVAAMYATFVTNEAEARKFWDSVGRGGPDFEDNAPATVLDNWLKEATSGELRGELKPAQFYQGAIYAWNAYREEKTLKEIKADLKKAAYIPKA